MLTLKQLLEIQPGEHFDIQKEEISILENVPNLLTVYDTALDKLPEIKASKTNISIMEKDLDIAKGAYLPTVALTGSIGSGFTTTQDLNFADQMDVNFNQRLELSVSVPIFNRNATKAAVQNAKINIEKAEIEVTAAEKELYQKIETAWQNANSSQE